MDDERTARQIKADELMTFFVFKKRNDGSEFYSLIDNAPEYLTELVHNAHNDFMPDDYKYEFIYDALDIIRDYEDEDYYYEGLDNYTECHTAKLLTWLASNINRMNYLEDVINNMFPAGNVKIFDALMGAQYTEREEVLNSVLSSIDSLIEEV
jgi:hypothetical protein